MRVTKFIIQVGYPYKFYFLGVVFALLIVSIDANIQPYLIKLLIDLATGVETGEILPLVIIFIIFQFLKVFSWAFNDWCNIQYSPKFRFDIISILTERISKFSYSFFQNHLTGTISAKIKDSFNLIPTLIFTATDQIIYFAISSTITLLLLAQVHIVFFIGMLSWIFLFLLITYFGYKRAGPLNSDYAESKSKIGGFITDYFGNILSVKSFATQTYEINKLNLFGHEYVEKDQRQGRYMMKFYIVQGITVSIYTIGFLFILIYLHHQGSITPGDFALVFMLNFRIADKLFQLSNQLRDFIRNWGIVDQALKILDMPTEISDRPMAKPLIVKSGEINFDKVHFHYKGTEPLFENKSVTIGSGQKVGLVGYSGSGKSTFVNLILRLFDVTSGHIFIDKQDIRDVTQDSLHEAIAMIPQDPSLFHRSLLENIRYGRLDASNEEIIEAAKKAHAHDFITALPHGYESLVGERGVKLSGGQRQRIAIARAILKNAPILILDEATSQLDSVTESYIQDSLWETMQGKTTLVIAHRLSTLLHMDRILVFDKGKVVEDGRHKDLLAKGKLYRTLWDAQVGGFLPDQKYGEDL